MPATLPAKGQRYDLIVIGSGPGGQRAAVQAAKLQKKVLLIERDQIGGGCLHTGTIPSKTLREAALHPELVTHDPLQEVMKRKEIVIRGEVAVITHQMERNHVAVLKGEASFLSKNDLAVHSPDGKSHHVIGDAIILATGSRPYRPEGLPFDDKYLFDSDTILSLKKLPGSLAIIGAGVIGCEYASIFSKLGVTVSLIDRRQTILRGVDEDILKLLSDYFKSQHIDLILGADLKNISSAKGGTGIQVEMGKDSKQFDAALYCMGRVGNIERLNLSNAGVLCGDRGIFQVSKTFQTNIGHIFAVGDAIGSPALAASAAEQGRLAALHALRMPAGEFPDSFPFGIYTIPEISSAGVQEDELKKRNVPYVVGRAHYRELARGKILGDEIGFLKLLAEKPSGKILGVHVFGTGATELVHIGQVTMSLGGNIDFLVQNVFNYPTLAEAYKVAALNAYNQLKS